MPKPINLCTWAMAALFVVGPAVAVLVGATGDEKGIGFALVALMAMMVLHLGLVVAPLAADRHWLLRLPVVLLMLPATGFLSVYVLAAMLEAVVRGEEHVFLAWSVIPAGLALCVYASTLLRLLVVDTRLGTLIRPTPGAAVPTSHHPITHSPPAARR